MPLVILVTPVISGYLPTAPGRIDVDLADLAVGRQRVDNFRRSDPGRLDQVISRTHDHGFLQLALGARRRIGDPPVGHECDKDADAQCKYPTANLVVHGASQSRSSCVSAGSASSAGAAGSSRWCYAYSLRDFHRAKAAGRNARTPVARNSAAAPRPRFADRQA